MLDRRELLASAGAIAATVGGGAAAGARPAAASAKRGSDIRLLRLVDDDGAELLEGGRRAIVRRGELFGPWTLMEMVPSGGDFVVLEDFSRRDDGHLLIVGRDGVLHDFPKTAEPTADETGGRHLGFSRADVAASAHDLLGETLLRKGDPDYAEVARAFPPIRHIWGDTYNFLGSPETMDKVWFQYGGKSPNFDPAVHQRSIEKVRADGLVRDGLVGGALPVLRFVYPEGEGDWSEMLAFAPLHMVEGNPRFQPVWYRVSRIEGGRLKWSRTIDSFLPFPPRAADDPRRFYADLLALKTDWDTQLAEAMTIDVPERRVVDMARFGLIRAIMTRSAGDPKYGVADKNYANSEHDGFPDTFTVETEAMLEWGLSGRAGDYIDNYFGRFVRADGSILYRGPETGQFGRMLTIAAQYAERGGDPNRLLRHRAKLDGIAQVLLLLRARALRLSSDDAAYGMLSAWSEADSCLEPQPQRYMQPYFSNSTEAARGLRDLGRVWKSIGRGVGDAALVEWGRKLSDAAEQLRKDIATATQRSLLRSDGRTVLPAIAGVKEPMDVAFRRDRSDPQWRSYRAYMEMLHSGNLAPEQVRLVVDYRTQHHDVIAGIPMAYGYATGEMAGFLSYGHGYGLIQADRVPEALLLAYSHMAHQHTRGMWMAPETRKVLTDEPAAPYCSPAQLVPSLVWKWLLVFEEPEAETLWLAKGAPRAWFRDGETIAVARAPTRWGRVGYAIRPRLREGMIEATINLPAAAMSAEVRLRLRAPKGLTLAEVRLDGRPWTRFDPKEETILLPPGMPGSIGIVAHYAGKAVERG